MVAVDAVDVRPVILAGGASARMGRPKPLIRLGGLTLVERLALACERAGLAEPIVVGGERTWAGGLRFAPDVAPGEGPLGGLITGFRCCGADGALLLLSCDLVSPSSEGIRAVVQPFRVGASAPQSVDAVVPEGERREVLHAVYGPRIAVEAELAFAGGERSLRRVLDHPSLTVSYLRVEPDSPLAASVRDVDTPHDLARYLAESVDVQPAVGSSADGHR